jgi:hypothetical protein
MKLAGYIKGDRRGREAHDIELDAMRDPLLGDAIDGFDAVPGDHSPALDRLSERIGQSAATGRVAARVRAAHLREKRIRAWSVAAAAVLIVGGIGGGVLLFSDGIRGGIRDGSVSGRIANETGRGDWYGPAEVMEILPPVTVVGNDEPPKDSTGQWQHDEDVIVANRIAVIADEPATKVEATDFSEIVFDETEIAELAGTEIAEISGNTRSGSVSMEKTTVAAAGIEPVADTVVTAEFRRYLAGVRSKTIASTRAETRAGTDADAAGVRSVKEGQVTLSFDVDAYGRPSNIEAVESPNGEEAAGAAKKLLSEGPDWPLEPSRKLITLNL